MYAENVSHQLYIQNVLYKKVWMFSFVSLSLISLEYFCTITLVLSARVSGFTSILETLF